MALVGLGVISIFKSKRHYKSRDIGESCTERTEDDDRRITANYHSLCVSLCLLYFLCTFHEVSLQIASLAWGTLYKLHTFSSFLCCSTHPICVQQHNMKKTCVICTGVVWLGSPATIALMKQLVSWLWDILIPVRVLLVIWCVLINW